MSDDDGSSVEYSESSDSDVEPEAEPAGMHEEEPTSDQGGEQSDDGADAESEDKAQSESDEVTRHLLYF